MNRTRISTLVMLAMATVFTSFSFAIFTLAAYASDELLPSAAGAETQERPLKHFSAGIYTRGSELVVETEHGGRTQELGEGWVVRKTLPGNGLALVRRTALQTQLRILDAEGNEVGRRAFAIDRGLVVSDSVIITSPVLGHGPLTAHDLHFFDASGTAIAEVSEPGLALISRGISDGGYVVTVSKGPAPEQRTVLIYRSDGSEHWRHIFSVEDRNQHVTALITRDGTRVAALKQIDFGSLRAEVSVHDVAGGLLASHDLSGVTAVVIAPNSDALFVVGTRLAALIATDNGALQWQTRLALEYFGEESIRFSPSGDEVVLVAVRTDRPSYRATQFLWRFDSNDGTSQRVMIGERGMERRFEVMDIVFDADEPIEVIMTDGVLQLPAAAGGTP
jgi:hypothetical protein